MLNVVNVKDMDKLKLKLSDVRFVLLFLFMDVSIARVVIYQNHSSNVPIVMAMVLFLFANIDILMAI